MSNARDFASRVPVDGALSNRNLIINGAMQVAQRGTSFTNHTGYTLDRWFNANPSTNTITQSFDATLGMYYMGVTQSSGYGTLTKIENKDARHLRAGDTITLSFWMDKEEGVVEFRPVGETAAEYTPTTIETSGSWFRRSASHTITAAEVTEIDAGDHYQINIEPRVNSYKLTGVQLEVGDTATPFEHRSYGDELARCMRYYVKVTATRGSGSGDSGGNTTLVSHRISPPMRVTPSVTGVPSTGYNLSNIRTQNMQKDHFSVIAATNGNYFYYNNGYNLEAEL